jgi:hypothetical protein
VLPACIAECEKIYSYYQNTKSRRLLLFFAA